MVPYFLGFPLKIGYTFAGVSALTIIGFLFSGFSLLTMGILAGTLVVYYIVATVLSFQDVARLEKKVFSTKLTAIKNNSMAPFRYDRNDK